MKQSPLIDRLEAASGHLEAGQVLHALNTLVSIRDGGHFNADLERHIVLLRDQPGDVTPTSTWLHAMVRLVRDQGEAAFSTDESLSEKSMARMIGDVADDFFDDFAVLDANSFAEESTRKVNDIDMQKVKSVVVDEKPVAKSLKEQLRETANRFKVPAPTTVSRPDKPAEKQTKPFGEPAQVGKLEEDSGRRPTPVHPMPVTPREPAPYDSGVSGARYAPGIEPEPPRHRLKSDDDSLGDPESQPGLRATPNLTPNFGTPAASADDDLDFDLGLESKPAAFAPSTVKAKADDDFDFDLGFDAPQPAFGTPVPPTAAPSFGTPVPPAQAPATSAAQTKPTSNEATAKQAPQRDPTPTPMAKTRDAGAIEEDEFFDLAESFASEAQSSHQYRGEPVVRGAASKSNPFNRDENTGVRPSDPSFVIDDLGSPASSVIGPSTNMSAILLEARRMYERGEFAAALDICNKVISRDESNPEADQLKANIEGELVRGYIQGLGSLQQVPKRSMDFAATANLNLDHRAGFILSQIDGMSTFEDLLELASMPRHEALKLFVKLLDVGAIAAE